MTDVDLIPLASERHQAVAATWAELFCKNQPGIKPVFIKHYIERTLIHRFWASSSVVNEQKIAVCRLGDKVMLAFHKGQIIKLNIKGDRVENLRIPTNSVGPTRQMARFLKSIQMKLQGPRSPGPSFDSLTSFSKQASGAVVEALTNDIPKILKVFPSEKSRYAGYYSIRKKRYISTYGNALKKFLSEVDQSILFTTRSIRCPSITVYNWLAAGNCERRLQALTACPVLIPLEIILGNAQGDQETLKELTSLIDNGKSFFQLLARLHDTTTSTIKKLGRLSPYLIGSALSIVKYDFTRADVQRLIAAFALGTKRPQTRKGWQHCRTAREATIIHFTESNLSGMPPWESDEWIDLIPQIRSLNDLGRCKEVLAKRSIRQALNFSTEWHAKRTEVQSILLTKHAFKACTWPGMLKGDVEHPATGLIFTEIVNDLSLAHEGESMGHCVGGYSRQCFDGRCRIISIRDGKKSLATLEYGLVVGKNGSKSYRCHQAQGPGNTPLKKKPAEALDWFTKKIRQFVSTYDLPVVPQSQRPESRANLSKLVGDQMSEWTQRKMEKLGYKDELKALNQHYEYYENY